MPSALTFPGVYVEEIPSGVRTITGVSTSSTAFVDYFARGPMGEAVRITSLAEFDRIFGGIDPLSEASYAISQYFLNGGSVAYVVRVAGATKEDGTAGTVAATANKDIVDAAGDVLLKVSAVSAGAWANEAVEIAAVRITGAPTDEDAPFNIFVRELARENGAVVPGEALLVEAFRGVSMDPKSPNFVVTALEQSELVRAEFTAKGTPTTSDGGDTGDPQGPAAWSVVLAGGENGEPPRTADELLGPSRSELRKLDAIAPEVFNLLCLPAAAALGKAAYDPALAYCIEKRAFLLVDIPESVDDPAKMRTALGILPSDNHAAVYFPRLTMPDPANGGRPRNVGASGTMAGIYARTDGTRGVWKAPAGTDAVIRGADLATVITDGDNGGLNPFGINALRNFPIFGSIVWGARTLDGADAKASEWKYVPVRRTALFIEESLFQALKWVVFEPNDEPLWAQIRLNVGAFMNDLFRQGAFQGSTPREAYFVKCDKDTTTQNDINKGIVNIAVGFAPLKPAEFVVIKLQQMAGQVQV